MYRFKVLIAIGAVWLLSLNQSIGQTAFVPLNDAHISTDTCTEDDIVSVDSLESSIEAVQSVADPIPEDRIEAQPRSAAGTPGWILFTLLAQLLLVVYLKLVFFRELVEFFRAYININIAQQHYRERELSVSFPAVLLNLNFIVSLALFTYLVISSFYGEGPADFGLAKFGWLLVFFTALYFLRSVTYRLIAFIFPFGNALRFYTFNFFLYQKVLGAALWFINLLLAYGGNSVEGVLVATGLVLLTLSLLARTFRGLMIFKEFLLPYFFHFIIYICTLEIAPVLILVKVLADYGLIVL